jgi:hypothetical protein
MHVYAQSFSPDNQYLGYVGRESPDPAQVLTAGLLTPVISGGFLLYNY